MNTVFYYTKEGEREAVKLGFNDRKAGTVARFAGEVLTDGRTARAWLAKGYIEKQKNYSFITTQPKERNWTPADLVREWAKKNHYQITQNKYFTTLVNVAGVTYQFGNTKKLESKDDCETYQVNLIEYREGV